MPEQAVDPWTAFLNWLSTILIPDWSGLIALLPILVILGVTGPGLTVLMLYWLYHFVTDRRGKVRHAEREPVAAEIASDGTAIYPANAPYCATHRLIYPATARSCDADGEELMVRCPIDETTRPASQSLCRVCGTRYQLGASLSPVVVRRKGQPPEGGAAVA